MYSCVSSSLFIIHRCTVATEKGIFNRPIDSYFCIWFFSSALPFARMLVILLSKNDFTFWTLNFLVSVRYNLKESFKSLDSRKSSLSPRSAVTNPLNSLFLNSFQIVLAATIPSFLTYYYNLLSKECTNNV
jgi:hypothetical protein